MKLVLAVLLAIVALELAAVLLLVAVWRREDRPPHHPRRPIAGRGTSPSVRASVPATRLDGHTQPSHCHVLPGRGTVRTQQQP